LACSPLLLRGRLQMADFLSAFLWIIEFFYLIFFQYLPLLAGIVSIGIGVWIGYNYITSPLLCFIGGGIIGLGISFIWWALKRGHVFY
jgi:hypothetical protein